MREGFFIWHVQRFLDEFGVPQSGLKMERREPSIQRRFKLNAPLRLKLLLSEMPDAMFQQTEPGRVRLVCSAHSYTRANNDQHLGTRLVEQLGKLLQFW